MTSFFFESPIWLLLCGGFVTAVAGYFWSQTGNRTAAYSAIGVAALTLCLAIVNMQVVTTREAVAALLHQIASELQANDREAVLSHIHPAAPGTVQRAHTELPRYEFDIAKVTRIKDITVNEDVSPPKVLAQFNVYVELQLQGQKVRVPSFIKVYFTEKDGRWLVSDYEHFEPTQGFKKES